MNRFDSRPRPRLAVSLVKAGRLPTARAIAVAPAAAGAVADDPSQPFYGSETLGGAEYFTAVYADVAVAEACVNCHNAHTDSPREDFAVGDTMGGVVIRIRMP